MTDIPARNSSKYARQYAGTLDAQRMVQIFEDSFKIALSSKSPDTASDRFALAVEVYHQLMSMDPPVDVRGSVKQSMETLVQMFPSQVVANEALGLREKARKLKTPRKRLELLNRAHSILERALADQPSSSVLQVAMADVRTEIAESGAVPD